MFSNLEVYNPDISGYIVTMELAYSFNDEVNEVTIGEFMKRISSYFSIPNDLYPYHPTSIAREGQFSIINKLYISNDKESNIRLQKFVNELKDTYIEYLVDLVLVFKIIPNPTITSRPDDGLKIFTNLVKNGINY